MKRLRHNKPGYDCARYPCASEDAAERARCAAQPGGIHGVHSDEAIFVVTDGTFAVTVTIATGYLRGERIFNPMFMSINGHADWPTDEDTIRRGEVARPCEWLDAGGCYSTGSSPSAMRVLFGRRRDNEPETARTVLLDPDQLWPSMERIHAEWRKEAETAPKVRQCGACGGRGVVPETETQ